MFYCDECARKEKYPIWEDERIRSLGPCEICEKTAPCNDMGIDMLELGQVVLYISKGDVLKTKRSCFRAEKGKLRVVGFDTKKIRGRDDKCMVPALYSKDFSEKADAVETVLNKRASAKESVLYFVYNDKGDMQKLKD